jgi:hypothetical protein
MLLNGAPHTMDAPNLERNKLLLKSCWLSLFQVGDGTTSVVVLAGEFLKEAKLAIEDGVHPQIIIKGYREAVRLVKQKIRELAIDISGKDAAYVKPLIYSPKASLVHFINCGEMCFVQ